MNTKSAAMEARCEKTRSLKQDMVQELIIGRTRLLQKMKSQILVDFLRCIYFNVSTLQKGAWRV